MSRILIIDDDSVLRRALRLALKKMGHDVVEGCDGRDGLQAYEIEPVDLVVTDLIMPDMEGLETIRTLKKMRPGLPIVAMSGGGRSNPGDYLQIAKQFGADKVIAKPFELSALCETVTALLAANENSLA